MVEWLAGNRIRGTTAERPLASLQSPSVGGWVELGRTTLGSNTSTIDVSSIADKRYYMILMDYTQTTDFSGLHQLGNSTIDTGSNYANRQSNNGGADSTGVSGTWVRVDNGWVSGDRKLAVEYISNLANKEKLIMNHMVRSAGTGAGTAPQRSEVVAKWANTSNPLDRFQMMNGGLYASGSEIVVLGWDPADTHTTNFWEELASVTLGSAGDTIDSGTITAKKYLWIQSFGIASGVIDQLLQFNSDTGNNYTYRYSDNGTADGAGTTTNKTLFGAPTGAYNSFGNMFVINNSANEKLCIGNGVAQNTAGAETAPTRREHVDKWTNTASQITSVQIINQGAGSFDTGSILKVWGSD